MAHKFALDAWSVRNNKEYDDTEVDSKTTKKSKLVRKILWYSDRIGNETNNPYKNTTEESLSNLPMPNLEIMEQQIETIYKYHKKKNERE
jgi:hypothetical protein